MKNNFKKWKKIKFLGRNYLVLNPIEEYLKDCYGDWKDKNNRKQGFPNF